MKIRKVTDRDQGRKNDQFDQRLEYFTTIGKNENADRVCCDTCIYYILRRCRRRAPLPLSVAYGGKPENTVLCGVWPVVEPHDLCGEWAAEWHIETRPDTCV